MARQVNFKTSNGIRLDPLRGYKFAVSDNTGTLLCGFSKVSGLSEESEVAEYRDGCDPVTMRKFPGLVTFENVVLERGLSVNGDLLAWREAVVRSSTKDVNKSLGDISTTLVDAYDGTVDGSPLGQDGFRRTLFIDLYDRGATVVQRSWELLEAWPCKLDDGELDASSSDVIIESAEICHEGLRRGFNKVTGPLSDIQQGRSGGIRAANAG